jgi:hypothetical protein
MVTSRQNPSGGESFREQRSEQRDSLPVLTETDRLALSVKRRERLQDIVAKTCLPLLKSAMQHHVSVISGWVPAAEKHI